MMTLNKSLVRSIVEYCSQLWSPSKLGLIRKIENIQRNFTARINEIGNDSYWKRLEKLDLYSLERRRQRYSILYVQKILSDLAPNFEEQRFQIKTMFSLRRGLHCRITPIVNNANNARVKTLTD